MEILISRSKNLIADMRSFLTKRYPGNFFLSTKLFWARKVCRLFSVILAFWWLSVVPVSQPEGAAPIEYQIKAAFIYKFINFIEWPDYVWENSADTIVIGVFGETPILEALDSIPHQIIKGRQIKIKHIKNLQDLKASHIAFIGEPDNLDLKNILDHLKRACVLTIGSSKEFARMGGMINFYLEKDKVRFEMNPEAANEAELKISSKILRLAKIVRTQRSSEEN